MSKECTFENYLKTDSLIDNNKMKNIRDASFRKEEKLHMREYGTKKKKQIKKTEPFFIVATNFNKASTQEVIIFLDYCCQIDVAKSQFSKMKIHRNTKHKT